METCHKPNCSWLALPSLNELKEAPPLRPNPELSGIGVILGFSITAYLTVALLIFHYIFVYDPHRLGAVGREYVNQVDRGVLTFIRERIISWTPSRRFEYAMEKSVLILSDTQLVTGLAILIAGYSQLSCGISSYHWQIMVFVAWFSSFTFLSAMAFLEGYFQTNNNLRLIRVFFMCILGGLMIAALLPTGSRNWLDAAGEGGPLYPDLSAECFFEQIIMPTYTTGGPRVWSMVFSVLVVSLSYVHSGVRLFDPTAEFSRKYFRRIPGLLVKKLLYFLERRATRKSVQAKMWIMPYLVVFAGYTSVRAMYDIAESMLAEIIWLSFAIGWGTIKVWDTRKLAWVNIVDGEHVVVNENAGDEDAWSFGQTLPLILLLLPILSMFQSYLDNDAKAQDAIHHNTDTSEKATAQESKDQHVALSSVRPMIDTDEEQTPDPHNSTSCSIRRCNHHQTSAGASCIYGITINDHDARGNYSSKTAIPSLPQHPSANAIFPESTSNSLLDPLPCYPYQSFFRYHWYRDHVYLLVCQILMLGSVILWVQSQVFSILGISYIIRNRLFLIWIFGFLPVSSVVHLAAWYLAALVVRRIGGANDWLNGRGKWSWNGGTVEKQEDRWWRNMTTGQWVFWGLRSLLKVGCLLTTFFASAQLAGPDDLDYGDG